MAYELRSSLQGLTAQLRQLNEQLQSKPVVEAGLLSEFRTAIDTIRLTAWTVHELSHARQAEKNPKVVLALLARERVKRFEQMTTDICSDLDSGLLHPEMTRKTIAPRIADIGRRLGAQS